MKNKGILSPVLMTENLKRNIYIAVLAAVVYYMSGILIFSMIDGSEKEEILRYSLGHGNPGYLAISVLMPLIISVVSMTFMHKKVQAMNLAAMPFSRKKIFLSNILSGWIICIAPAVFNGLAVSLSMANYFGTSMIWILQTICQMTFYYGMFTLAGILTGTTVKHVLLSGVFFCIIPVITLCTMGYAENFLPGFAEVPDFVVKIVRLTNPLIDAVINAFAIGGENTEFISPIYYLAVGLIMLLISIVLYNKVKLEKIGKSVVFKSFEDILSWLVAFVGMNLFGLLVFVIINTKASAIAGMVIGGLMSFIIIKVIIEKSSRIFSRRNVVSLAVFLILAILFAAFVIFDAGGYSKKIPDAEKIESVSIDSWNLFDEYDTYYLDNVYLKSDENIETALRMHEYAAKNNIDEYAFYEQNEHCMELRLEYKMKNGKILKRDYYVKIDDYYRKLLKKVKTSDEYRPAVSLENRVDINSVDYVELHVDIIKPDEEYGETQDVYYESVTLTDKKKIKELFDVCSKVKYENSLKEHDSDKTFEFGTVNISVFQRNKPSENDLLADMNSTSILALDIEVNKDDKELVDYIEKIYEQEGKKPFAGILN